MVRLEQCIADVKVWARDNNLMLNGAKTELMHVTSAFQKASELPDFEVDCNTINPSKSSINLESQWMTNLP